MSDATPARVRDAAEALKAAIDRHLLAVENRTGEADPAVFTAFDDLAAAADVYDELLYDVHDEVTPFEVPSRSKGTEVLDEDPQAITVLIRRDYLVGDAALLVESARQAVSDSAGAGDDETEPAADRDINDTGDALVALFDTFEVDEIHERSEEIGLEQADSTVWVLAAPATGPGEWLADPFGDVDSEHLLYRLDVVAEDEADVAEDDELEDVFDEDEIDVEDDDVDGVERV
jgi:hypothetical protein